MRIRVIGTRAEVAASLAAHRAAGMVVHADRELPARDPRCIRVYTTVTVPETRQDDPIDLPDVERRAARRASP